MKKSYPDAISRYQLDGFELDIYIPSIKTGIEYDGQFYHGSNASEMREQKKNRALLVKNVHLIRIKETDKNSCNSNTIYFKYDTNYKELPWAIKSLFNLLNGNDQSCIDLDIVRDRNLIFQQYIQMEKENSLAEKYPEIAKEWNYEKNGSLEPTMVSYSSNKKFWWKCKYGHEWESTVGKRTAGRNCPVCSSNKLVQGVNDLATVNPVLAKQWHPTKNGLLRPDKVFPNYMKKVWWRCDKGHEWEETPNNRMRGKNCPYCSGHRVWHGFNDLATTHPEIAKEWHPIKNDDLTPQDITAGRFKPVWWLCSKCRNEYIATIRRKVTIKGTLCCPVCNNNYLNKNGNPP